MDPIIAQAQQTKRPFTVADEIGLTLFGTPHGGEPQVRFSPDGQYVVVWSERGRLDLNCVEDNLRFYRSSDIESFLTSPDGGKPLSPAWQISRCSYKEGAIINDWRWLSDSSGVAFLERIGGNIQQLTLANLMEKTIEPLTPVTEAVKGFEVRSRQHYVYTTVDSSGLEKERQTDAKLPAIVGTGRPSIELLFPNESLTEGPSSNRAKLWEVVEGHRFEVKSKDVALAFVGNDLELSPDGFSLVTQLPVAEVSATWEKLYVPPCASYFAPIHAGHKDLDVDRSVHQYVRVNLRTGSVQTLTDAPTSNDAGWFSSGTPSWSSDGQAILLPGTFLTSNDEVPSRPCIAVIDLASDNRTCVETLKSVDYGKESYRQAFEEGYHYITSVSFAGGDKHRVLVTFMPHGEQPGGTAEYQQSSEGTWRIAGVVKGEAKTQHNDLAVTVKQGFNTPPLLMARNKEKSRILWDPNPQLKNLELGEADVYEWKDKEGRDWKGGLYKPVGYKAGERYPLVIQTHGFVESEFRPSGVFTTAFAARALAAAGIVVLQTAAKGWCPLDTPEEGPCNASMYETAAKQLVADGVADPNKIGIIGFSRTCFEVMDMLTTSSLNLAAASITDGVMFDYFQYILWSDRLPREANPAIGAPPFGEGLQQWLKRSPGFNLDKIKAPLMVVGEGRASLLSMWAAYAGLHYLHKPVDLIMLNTDEHILTNPAERVASQGGSVDWFRFWLRGEEDPDPTKAEQYARWRELRKLQEENEENKVTHGS
jgi:dipeptidyl aminopeptidase/acylaminoacyl peptidase